jgi:hypothetical protein
VCFEYAVSFAHFRDGHYPRSGLWRCCDTPSRNSIYVGWDVRTFFHRRPGGSELLWASCPDVSHRYQGTRRRDRYGANFQDQSRLWLRELDHSSTSGLVRRHTSHTPRAVFHEQDPMPMGHESRDGEQAGLLGAGLIRLTKVHLSPKLPKESTARHRRSALENSYVSTVSVRALER